MCHFLSGEITAAESLFTYSEGQSAAFFSHPDHDPLFLDEVLASADNATLAACAGNALCVFDALQTGNLAIGLTTLEILEEIETTRVQSGIFNINNA